LTLDLEGEQNEDEPLNPLATVDGEMTPHAE
jgi:hypothetical protein